MSWSVSAKDRYVRRYRSNDRDHLYKVDFFFQGWHQQTWRYAVTHTRIYNFLPQEVLSLSLVFHRERCLWGLLYWESISHIDTKDHTIDMIRHIPKKYFITSLILPVASFVQAVDVPIVHQDHSLTHCCSVLHDYHSLMTSSWLASCT